MRLMYKCNVGLRIVEGRGSLQLELCWLHNIQSHVTPQRTSILGSFEDDAGPKSLVDSDDEEESDVEEADEDDDENVDAWDDNDSSHDNDDAQPSVADGMYPDFSVYLIAY